MDRTTNPMSDRVALGVTAAMLLLALLAGAVVVAVGTAIEQRLVELSTLDVAQLGQRCVAGDLLDAAA
jgi:hypothetical protein